MYILHLNQRNQRNQILFQYLRDKKKKEGGLEKGGGVKIHPFHLPWICACIATDLTQSEELTIRHGWLATVRMGWAEVEVRVAIRGFVMYRSGKAISLRLHADIQERNREVKPSMICRQWLPVPQRLSTKHCRWLSITAYTVSSRLSRLPAMYVQGRGLVQLLLGSLRIWKNMYTSVAIHGILLYPF